MFKCLDGYSTRSGYGCHLGGVTTPMNSNNLNDAKKECHNNPSCHMFQQENNFGEDLFAFCTDSAVISLAQYYNSRRKILYVKDGNWFFQRRAIKYNKWYYFISFFILINEFLITYIMLTECYQDSHCHTGVCINGKCTGNIQN